MLKGYPPKEGVILVCFVWETILLHYYFRPPPPPLAFESTELPPRHPLALARSRGIGSS